MVNCAWKTKRFKIYIEKTGKKIIEMWYKLKINLNSIRLNKMQFSKIERQYSDIRLIMTRFMKLKVQRSDAFMHDETIGFATDGEYRW